MTELHETRYGRTFFEYQLPELIKALKDIARELGNKRTRDIDSMKINNVVFKAEDDQGVKYVIVKKEPMCMGDSVVYHLYIDGLLMDRTYGSLVEAIDEIVSEIC